jgi:hypothetical protein
VLVLSVDWFIGMARARQSDRQLRCHRRHCGLEDDLDRDKAKHVADGEELVDVTAG